MDEHAFASLVGEHERFPQAIRSLLGGWEPDALRRREAADRWSPLEILVHLRDEETEDFRARARAASRGETDVAEIDPRGWVRSRSYNREDPREILEDLERERSRSCEWLRGLTPEDLGRRADFPYLGPMRCGDFVAAWRVHDLLHLRQLATALIRLTARDLDGWATPYAGRIP